MTADKFTEAAADAAADLWTPIHTTTDPLSMPERRHRRIGFTMGAEWARTHLTSQETADGGYGTRSTEAVRGWTGAWPAAHEPTDAEVEAAAIQLCASAHHDLVWKALAKVEPKRQEHFRNMARAALSAARAARRDEEKR